MNLTLGQIAAMLDISLSNGSNADLLINNVVIDSNHATSNNLFVAITTMRNDGHKYIGHSLANGALGALVQRNPDNLPNMLVVEDTVKALGKLAAKYRSRFDIPIVAITGSNGKTTVKEMLKLICNHSFGAKNVLATLGNQNNHLGAPLTILNLEPNHKVAIIEMGMSHAGELDYLVNLIKPTISLITNVKLAHAEFFTDLTAIAMAKGEIYNGLAKQGLACVNMTSKFSKLWLDKLTNLDVNIFKYGDISSGYYLENIKANSFDLVTPYGVNPIHLKVLGAHNADNALSAAVIAFNLNCSLENVSKALGEYGGYTGRLQPKTAFNGALIIDDTYNANLDSVKAAILAIKELPRPHYLIFADIKELGKFSEQAHREVGEFAQDNQIDVLLTIGEQAKLASLGFKNYTLHFNSNIEVVEYCLANLPKNATLLVKGSNSMKLKEVVAKLTD